MLFIWDSLALTPAVSDGVVYFGSTDNHLYALDAKTGKEKWKFKTGDWVSSSPAVSDGVVYFGSYKHIYALDIEKYLDELINELKKEQEAKNQF